MQGMGNSMPMGNMPQAAENQEGVIAPLPGQQQVINITDGEGSVYLVNGNPNQPELQTTILRLQAYALQQ